MRTGLYHHPSCKDHDPGPGHPECPARYDAVMDALQQARLGDKLIAIKGRAAVEDELALCHSREYIATARADVAAGRSTLSTGDTTIGHHSLDAACLATGGVLAAVDALMRGAVENAFCVARPPGHHATPDRGMGFCLFNSVAIAARYAQTTYDVKRVLIADWDVHHGNGTQDIFYADPSVLFFSTHQWPLYPGTGAASETGSGEGKGYTINCPLPAGSGRDEIFDAFDRNLAPAVAAFKPDLILISAGFDSRAGDPLGEFQLRDGDFFELTTRLRNWSDQTAAGRVLSVLEGGYNLEGLGAASAAHVRALLD